MKVPKQGRFSTKAYTTPAVNSAPTFFNKCSHHRLLLHCPTNTMSHCYLSFLGEVAEEVGSLMISSETRFNLNKEIALLYTTGCGLSDSIFE